MRMPLLVVRKYLWGSLIWNGEGEPADGDAIESLKRKA